MTVQEIIEKWPSASEMARDLGLRRPSHGTVIKMRGSIPVQYWTRLVAAAERRGIKGVTLEALAASHEPHPREAAE
jgi:hypothetical protein